MSANRDSRGINRRDFLIQTGAIAGGAMIGAMAGCASNSGSTGTGGAKGVAIVVDPDDPVASAKPSQWAVEQLRQSLSSRDIPARVCEHLSDAPPNDFVIVVAGDEASMARDLHVVPSGGPESLAIMPGKLGKRPVLAAIGADVRGAIYATTELADAVALEPDPWKALNITRITQQRPANQVRSVMRMFSNDIEDKPWFNDQEFWKRYLTTLVSYRFNRVNMSFGLSYDAPSNLTDTYFYFTYPFLLPVPGYDVRATNLSDAERDRNLEMLRFISDEAAARGLHFQLGLWTHAYEWINSPNANHVIEGLTPQTQAPYCRDALAILLKECPNINGVTFRIHGESGVAEGSYDLWRMIFDGCKRSGRHVEIDMHAKGMDQGTIDAALNTGLPLTISPKYWAEHMGLPYHQAAIRATELPVRERGGGAFAQSNGARSFLRYGYGDLLTEDRKYGIIHRMWPGTQRLLLWGDPTFAASYGRVSSFCGSLGCELMEPLSFKGRKGSGIKGDRGGYKDSTLIPEGGDFEKFSYYYRVWGRLMYDPDERPEVWQRQLRKECGTAAAPHAEIALASASRILPLSTTAHLPAASNNQYWPEIYVNMPIASVAGQPFNEGPTPRRFGTVSPLDPQLFSRIEDHVDLMLKKEPSGKYSPAEVAAAFETLSTQASSNLELAQSKANKVLAAEFRRFCIDVSAQSSMGMFFAHKLRAGLCYALFDRTGNEAALAQSLKSYRAAREAWMKLVDVTKDAYVEDLTYGPGRFQRGHWSDRLDAIDQDIATMETKEGSSTRPDAPSAEAVAAIIQQILAPPPRPNVDIKHAPPTSFERGKEVSIALTLAGAAPAIRSVDLYYRHTHQAQPWQVVAMQPQAAEYRASVPSQYTDTAFPVEYYFEVRDQANRAWLNPGFNDTWSNQPYWVVRQRA